MDRQLKLHLNDDLFFDNMFKDMEREIARMHYDMRSAMQHLTPVDPLACATGDMESRISQLRNVFAEKEGERHLDIALDLSQFKPEEIEVKASGTRLWVKAKHEEKNDHSKVYHEFHREFTLPGGTDVERIKSSLTKDSVLTISGPLPVEGAKTEKVIPITMGDN